MRLPDIKTEAMDSLILHEDEAHGVDSDGKYVCRVRASIISGPRGYEPIEWKEHDPCNTVILGKDVYRRHFEERHLALSRNYQGKYVKKEEKISTCSPLDS